MLALLPLLWMTPRSPADSAPTIRAAGPAASKRMMQELLAEFSARPGNTAVALDYAPVDGLTGAAGALVAGRDIAITVGRISDKDLSLSRDGWRKLAPQEHVVGGRALAIVVHPRSPVESLTMDQIRSIYSAKEKEWKVFGGDAKSIRRYGLNAPDPLCALFSEKVLPPVKCGVIQRKKDSGEAMAAVAGDPQGIAFIDAVAALSAGDAVKLLGIGGDERNPGVVLPNARTIKDGTYTLSQPLALYVSPKAADPAPAFTRFLLSGDGDAIVRKHGFLPTVRAVKPDLLAAFQKLYGSEIKRVRATAGTEDDLALAGQMIDSARKIKLDEDMLIALCSSAYELAFPAVAVAGDGQVMAFEAICLLRQKVPEQAMDCHLWAAALYERAYKADKSPSARADGEHLIEKLMAAADAGTSAGQFPRAAEAWRRALAVAEELGSQQLLVLRERLPAFVAREQTPKQLDDLLSRLRANNRDPGLRRQVLWLHLMELDDPVEAMKFLDAAEEESWKTNIPLACERTEKLSEDGALTLGEWYCGLADKAQVGGRELMASRALRYYLWFFQQHKDREGALATRAALGIRKVGGEPPPPPTTKPAKPILARPPQNTTDLSLAEFVAGHLSAASLTGQQIGSARLITDARCLSRLAKLTSLELQQAETLKEIPTFTIGNVTSLSVTGLSTEKIGGVSSFPNLTALDLSGAKNVTDLTPISRLSKLQKLNLSGCERLMDLAPLAALKELTSLTLAGCDSLSDVKPLEGLSAKLASLTLRGCPKITEVSTLLKLRRLKTLDFRECPGIATAAIEELQRDLPDCRILTSSPAKTPTAAVP